jgi:Flp pilus assembly protein TadB
MQKGDGSMIRRVVRWSLGAGLLWIVWHHAHWSVALSLTLIFFALELRAVVASMQAARLRRLMGLEVPMANPVAKAKP